VSEANTPAEAQSAGRKALGSEFLTPDTRHTTHDARGRKDKFEAEVEVELK
jgi:hypothetical protein